MSLTLCYSTITNVTVSDSDARMLAICHRYNEKVEAIKFIRINYGLGLKESKDMVDHFWVIQDGAGVKQHWSTKYLSESDYTGKMADIETQGYKAQAAGRDLVKDNPYSIEFSDDKHWAWRAGYIQAVRDSN